MRELLVGELSLIGGGEVGVTHQGDDRHYTGGSSVDNAADFFNCVAGHLEDAWMYCGFRPKSQPK